MLSKEVQNYIASAKGLPFFYVTGDSDYNSTLAELKQAGLSVVRMSDLCYKDDKFPSIDDLIDNFRTSDIDYRDNKFVVIGLGEFLAIKGEKAAERELNRLKATTLGTARVVLLLRGVSFQANAMISDDGRILSQQRAYVSENTTTNISIVNLPSNSGMVKKDGIKALLKTLEDGVSGSISVSTELYLDAAIFPVTTIASSHAILNMKVKQFNLPVEIGTEEQWAHLLKDVRKNGPYLTETFSKYEIDDSIFDNLYEMIAGIEYKNWLVFLYCKHFLDKITNKYLQYVIENTTNYEDFKNNILTYIINIPHADPDYQQMYDSRKRLIRQYPEEDFAVFIRANEADQTESIYRFTDTTFIERKAVIKWIAHNGLSDINLNGNTLTVNGDAVQYGNIDLNAGTLNVKGDFNHNGGELNINNGLLDIEGCCNVLKSNYKDMDAIVLMNNPHDSINIGKDFNWDVYSSWNAYSYFSAGILTITGDFINNGFYSYGSHKIVLNGNEEQKIKGWCDFNLLQVLNPDLRNIIYEGKLSINNLLSDINIDPVNLLLNDINLNGKTMTVYGDATQNGDIDLNGGTLYIKGNLEHKNGKLNINNGTLITGPAVTTAVTTTTSTQTTTKPVSTTSKPVNTTTNSVSTTTIPFTTKALLKC